MIKEIQDFYELGNEYFDLEEKRKTLAADETEYMIEKLIEKVNELVRSNNNKERISGSELVQRLARDK